MKSLSKVVTFIIGISASILGLNAVVTQELAAQGSLLRGAGWHMQGTPAIVSGLALLAIGLYIIWLAFTVEE